LGGGKLTASDAPTEEKKGHEMRREGLGGMSILGDGGEKRAKKTTISFERKISRV